MVLRAIFQKNIFSNYIHKIIKNHYFNSSDSVVGSDRKSRPSHSLSRGGSGGGSGGGGARMSTQPINIPGSPQRQSSSSTTDDDDMLLIVPEVSQF